MRFLIISTFIVLTFQSAVAQHVIFAGNNKYDVPNNKHFGVMLLKNGETISGILQYAYFAFPYPDIKYYSDSGKLIRRYKLDSIKQITFAGSDTSLSNKDSTYFITIKSKLFRQLTFGSIKLYDPLVCVDERKGLIASEGYFHENVFAIENDSIKRFEGKKDILRFVHEKLIEKGLDISFKTLQQAVRYFNYNNI